MKTINRKLLLSLAMLGIVGLSFESGAAFSKAQPKINNPQSGTALPVSCNQFLAKLKSNIFVGGYTQSYYDNTVTALNRAISSPANVNRITSLCVRFNARLMGMPPRDQY